MDTTQTETVAQMSSLAWPIVTFFLNGGASITTTTTTTTGLPLRLLNFIIQFRHQLARIVAIVANMVVSSDKFNDLLSPPICGVQGKGKAKTL